MPLPFRSAKFICKHYIYRHNDLPYNFYGKLNNHLSGYHFKSDLSHDDVWGNAACSSCYTDLPRLVKGKVGGQVSHETSHERPYEINYLRTAQPICFTINRLAILSRNRFLSFRVIPLSPPALRSPCGRKKVIILTPRREEAPIAGIFPPRS